MGRVWNDVGFSISYGAWVLPFHTGTVKGDKIVSILFRPSFLLIGPTVVTTCSPFHCSVSPFAIVNNCRRLLNFVGQGERAFRKEIEEKQGKQTKNQTSTRAGMWPWQNHVLLAQTIYAAKGKTIEIKPKEVEHINILCAKIQMYCRR